MTFVGVCRGFSGRIIFLHAPLGTPCEVRQRDVWRAPVPHPGRHSNRETVRLCCGFTRLPLGSPARASSLLAGPQTGRSVPTSCETCPDLRALIHSALTLRTGLGAGLPMPVFQNENGV